MGAACSKLCPISGAAIHHHASAHAALLVRHPVAVCPETFRARHHRMPACFHRSSLLVVPGRGPCVWQHELHKEFAHAEAKPPRPTGRPAHYQDPRRCEPPFLFCALVAAPWPDGGAGKVLPAARSALDAVSVHASAGVAGAWYVNHLGKRMMTSSCQPLEQPLRTALAFHAALAGLQNSTLLFFAHLRLPCCSTTANIAASVWLPAWSSVLQCCAYICYVRSALSTVYLASHQVCQTTGGAWVSLAAMWPPYEDPRNAGFARLPAVCVVLPQHRAEAGERLIRHLSYRL